MSESSSGSPNLTPRHSSAQAKPGATPGAPPLSDENMHRTVNSDSQTNQPTALTRYFLCLINFPASHAELNMSLLLVLTEMGGSGCTVTEGGPCNSFFLIEKNKATHKGPYCTGMITGSSMLLEYLQ